MAKKIFLLPVLIFATVVLCSTPVFAESWFYVSDAQGGSEVSEGVFNDAWLHVSLPNIDWKNSWFTLWLPPSGDDNTFQIRKPLGMGYDDWVHVDGWDTKREVGDWNVNGSFRFTNGTTGCATKSFTVMPEPVSSALFLLGAGALGIKRLRRKKS